MDRLAFNAVAAINESRLARQQLVHELANASTPGFKRSYDATMVAMRAGGAGFDTRAQPQVQARDEVRISPAPVMATGNPLDISLNDGTVLGVEDASGTLAFTRRGDLRAGPGGLLENGAGQVVRGEAGPITVPPGAQLRIAADGRVLASNPEAGPETAPVEVARLLLRDASALTLARRTDGLLAVAGQPPGTDLPATDRPGSVTPGALEGSNVNTLSAMVRLIDQSRSFEQHVRMIKQSKELDESGAAMLRGGA